MGFKKKCNEICIYPIGLTLIIFVLFNNNANAQQQKVVIDVDFPGGNIIVQNSDNNSTLYYEVTGDTISVRPDLRDTEGSWFYWYFRVKEATGRTLHFKFPNENFIGVHGPAFSIDEGGTWEWLGDSSVRGTTFQFSFPNNTKEVRFCVGIPYVDSDLQEFLNRYKENPNLKVEILAKTKKERYVELLRFGRIDGDCDHRILITCRHHACETMGNYCLEGIIESVLSDSEVGKWFRHHVEFIAIPFVDKDGVQDGDQGKNRKPHDHNQDYNIEKSIYPSVLAIKEFIPGWSEGKLRFSLDIHCPGLRGKYHEMLLFPTRLRGNENWNQIEKFLVYLEKTQTGTLNFKLKNSLSFTSWSGDTNIVIPNTSSRWIRKIPGVLFATSIEIPYSNASGKKVTDKSAKYFGNDIASAIRNYLENEIE